MAHRKNEKERQLTDEIGGKGVGGRGAELYNPQESVAFYKSFNVFYI
jgi:hypothetical protein